MTTLETAAEAQTLNVHGVDGHPHRGIPTTLASSIAFANERAAAQSESSPSTGTAAPTAKPTQRDGFLDTLRAIALGRVIVWHAIGLPIISWFVATMPVMFFVAGTLLHGSLERRPAGIVLRRRLKRLLVPYWLFGALALSFLSIVHLRGLSSETAVSVKQLVWWIFPLRDPSASVWEAGWASSPLWYLRAYLWILLLSPLLMKAWRKFGLLSLVPPFLLMIAAHVVSVQGVHGPGAAIWLFGDLGIYSFFVLLGFAHTCGAFDALSARDFAEWTLTFAAVTAVAWYLAPSDDGVVNHSYPTLWAIGLMWISAFHIVRPLIGRATTNRFVGPVVYWSSRRAMSVYLWHSPAIVGSYWLLAKVGVGSSAFAVLVFTMLLTMLASLLTGWIEDVAGGKPGELWPTRSGVSPVQSLLDQFRSHVSNRSVAIFAGGAVTALVVASLAIGAAPSSAAPVVSAASESGLRLPPAPSGRPDPQAGAASVASNIETNSAESTGLRLPPAPSGRPDPQAAVAGDAAGSLAAVSTSATSVSSASLEMILELWRNERGVQGVGVMASTAGQPPQAGFSGQNADGSELHAADSFAATSITKTMTAAMILQLVDEGALVLDDPAPALAAVPEFNAERNITLRHLLNHSSGLVPYQQGAGYDAAAALSPAEAVAMSSRTPLEWAPGAAGGYSNSGYLALGLLIEQATGLSYEEALTERILEPYGLANTFIDTAPTAGWVGSSAGGLVSTVDDLYRWGNALYRDQNVLAPEQLTQMMTVDALLSSGLGAFPVCPCTTTPSGTLDYTSIGHNGGSVTMQYAPGTDTLVVASFSQSFWTTSLTQQDVYQLLATVRSTVAS